jgi:amino acid transporter
MVAGWDNLLPECFTRLRPKYKTPTNSILFIALVTLVASVVVLVGVNEEEALSLIQIWAFTLYGLVYLVMFAIPLADNRARNSSACLAEAGGVLGLYRGDDHYGSHSICRPKAESSAVLMLWLLVTQHSFPKPKSLGKVWNL